jgi:hypothetical protein
MKYTVITTNGSENGTFLGANLDYIKLLIARAGHTILQIIENGTPY